MQHHCNIMQLRKPHDSGKSEPDCAAKSLTKPDWDLNVDALVSRQLDHHDCKCRQILAYICHIRAGQISSALIAELAKIC